MKPEEKIRICAYYKITVNEVIRDVKHSLPRMEDLLVVEVENFGESQRCSLFFYDMVVTEHLVSLSKVFRRIEAASLKLSLEKCAVSGGIGKNF